MERQEYIRRLVAAYDAMDDEARELHLCQFELSAEKHPRSDAPRIRPVLTLAPVVPLIRVAVG